MSFIIRLGITLSAYWDAIKKMSSKNNYQNHESSTKDIR